VARLAELVRSTLGLRASTPVEVRADGEHSNINHVYRVRYGAGRSLYLKVVPARPRKLPVTLPRERFLSEAEAIRRFGRLAGGAVVVPEVLFVDRDCCALGMSDVGGGRRVLLDLLPGRYSLLAEQAEPLGRALAAVHAGSRGMRPLRPAAEAAAIEAVIFDGLLAPGARAVFPESWEEIHGELRSGRRVLVHADLWGKNLLVAPGRPVAVVDFEGAMLGDPAFDLGTLLAVAVLPAFERPAVLPQAAGFVHRLLATYVAAAGAAAGDEARASCRRGCRAAAVFLAARGFGPFAYPLADRARERLAELTARLARRPPESTEAFVKQAILHAGGLAAAAAD
jgi:aminoglycoside phosphotransferase (APT) family kinase protein